MVDQDFKNESMDVIANEGEGPRWKKNFVNYKKKGGIRKFFNFLFKYFVFFF